MSEYSRRVPFGGGCVATPACRLGKAISQGFGRGVDEASDVGFELGQVLVA